MTERSTKNQDTNTSAQQDFLTELAEVEQLLLDATAELFPPFRQMVAAQLRNSYPLRRAGVVLTAGVSAPDDIVVRRQRISLAAALEMLHLALAVHMMLANTMSSDPANRSLLGSTILAGDYCFSRSAILAVRTGNATVVEIFSDALKRVSEGHLRHIFAQAATNYNEDRQLFVAGAAAAMQLANTPEAARHAILHLAETLAQTTAQAEPLDAPEIALDPYQRQRWQVLLHWQPGA